MLRFLAYLPFAFLLAACANAPDFPDEPVIVYEGVDKDEIFQAILGIEDSITFHLTFTDGDGDLGQDSTSIFFTESRLGSLTPFKIRPFPTEGTGNGINGDLYITLINPFQGICCIVNNQACQVNESFPLDTVSYTIQIMDRAGNLSNSVKTDVINIKCLRE